MALKSTELRIGNIIADHKGDIKTVTAYDLINLEGLEQKLHHDPRCKDWKGIPLDKSLADKLHFAVLENGLIISFGGVELVKEQGVYRYYYTKDHWHDIYYAHQFQNLIHSTTGTELEVKL